VLWRTPLRGNDNVAVPGLSVEQGEYEFLAGFPARSGQEQRRDRHLRVSWRGHSVQVPFITAARAVAIGVVDHPLSKIRGELRLDVDATSRSSYEK